MKSTIEKWIAPFRMLFIIVMSFIFVGTLFAAEVKTVVIQATVTAFDCQNPTKPIGTFAPGTSLEISDFNAPLRMYVVKYTPESGEPVVALCRGDNFPSFITQRERAVSNTTVTSLAAQGLPFSNSNYLARLSQSLFPCDEIFSASASAVSQRLGLESMASVSRTRFLSVYQRYKPYMTVGGVRPEMISILGDPEHVSEIDIVFANMADLFSDVNSECGPDHIDKSEITAQMREQHINLQAQLRLLFGEPVRAAWGTASFRERMLRWDYQGVTFLLNYQDQRILSLKVLPRSIIERNFKMQLTDEQLAVRLRSCVTRRPNGDVVITEVPMLDQGRKGYCAAASLERAMRYVGLPVDMYSLALMGRNESALGNTKKIAGTPLNNLYDAVEMFCKAAGRQLKWGVHITMPELKRYVDNGIPVIWLMCIDSRVEEISDTQTKARQQYDAATWSQQVRAYARVVQPSSQATHIRLIIGYNDATDEIAYSDSWGNLSKERWLCIRTAKAISYADQWQTAIVR